MTRPLPLLISLLALTASALVLAGCQNGSDAPAAPAAPEAPGAPAPPATPTAGATAEGEDHAHAAPHGGTVKTAGAGHLELVVDGRNLMVYPLDGSEAALSFAGVYIGHRFGARFGKRLEVVGGLVLLALAFKALADHYRGGV